MKQHNNSIDDLPPLGGGGDLTGRSVNFFGRCWTITGKNYLGDWDVECREKRDDGTFVLRSSSISSRLLPESHGHFAELLP
jgi:hypothetical protein